MVLTGDRCGFAVRTYFENNQSVITFNFRVAQLGDLRGHPTTAKGKDYWRSYPNTLPQLRKPIIEEVNAIPCDTCGRAVRNFSERLQQCVAANGHPLANIVFST